jgi:hypothetical protein
MPNTRTPASDVHVILWYARALRSCALSLAWCMTTGSWPFNFHYLEIYVHLLMSDCFQGDKTFRNKCQTGIWERRLESWCHPHAKLNHTPQGLLSPPVLDGSAYGWPSVQSVLPSIFLSISWRFAIRWVQRNQWSGTEFVSNLVVTKYFSRNMLKWTQM